MAHRRRIGIALGLALAASAAAAARQALLQPPFYCGTDQIIPTPIPLSSAALILAGDGRFYSPCSQPFPHGPDHREIREATVIGEGRYSADIQLRWRAAQAEARNSSKPEPIIESYYAPRSTRATNLAQVDGLGGFINPPTSPSECTREVQFADDSDKGWQPGRLFMMLSEIRGMTTYQSGTSPMLIPMPNRPGAAGQVRPIAVEGAYAIGTLIARPELKPYIVAAAARELRACFDVIGANVATSAVAPLILEDLGLARYGTEDEIVDAENYLVQQSFVAGTIMLGSVKALEALIRLHPQHEISENTRIRLRQLVMQGDRLRPPPAFDTDARIRRLALQALATAHDFDYSTLRAAATDADWQMRRMVAASLSFADPEMAALGEILANDPAFQVRYDALTPLSRRAAQTGDCGPIIARLGDPSPVVVMRAMDVLAAKCNNLDETIKTLASFADRLTMFSDTRNWNVNVRALAALARLKPAEARSRIADVASHSAWQVRVVVATLTGQLGGEDIAKKLAHGDSNPNVRSAALEALYRMKSSALVPEAISALQSASDNGLIQMATTVLNKLPDDSKDEASTALILALRRLSLNESDTSHDARLSIVARLGETLNLSRSGELIPYMGAVDDEVNAAVVRLYTKLTTLRPPPVSPKRRYPYQPPAASLAALPSQALIELDNGIVTVDFVKDVAPVTIARFAELVGQRYYTGRTFHRVVPNFVAQGGSPGDNDFMGVTRFLRDEIGPQALHLRGAVGMSSRGKDMGDGQFFIDLVDLPRFDRDYTVFGYVTAGMDVVDRIIEGTKIVGITVK